MLIDFLETKPPSPSQTTTQLAMKIPTNTWKQNALFLIDILLNQHRQMVMNVLLNQ